jgi:hypothetical protein
MLLRSLFSRLAACFTYPVARGTSVRAHPESPILPAAGSRHGHLPIQGLLVSLSSVA